MCGLVFASESWHVDVLLDGAGAADVDAAFFLHSAPPLPWQAHLQDVGANCFCFISSFCATVG